MKPNWLQKVRYRGLDKMPMVFTKLCLGEYGIGQKVAFSTCLGKVAPEWRQTAASGPIEQKRFRPLEIDIFKS